MKWFFCWCQETESRADHGWPDLIRAAVASALRHTNLEPHFIYDGEPSDLTAELESAGVTIHYHRLSFADALDAHQSAPTYRAIARGAFLRFDIPLFCDDDFALYTDADVLFRPGFDLAWCHPAFVAAAPQSSRGACDDMNSGVMLMNVPAWRARRDELLAFTRANLHLGLDQEVLRAWLGTDYTLLADRYNWKPYWGPNDDAALIHWHGPKPEAAADWLRGDARRIGATWLRLLETNRCGYEQYVELHEATLMTTVRYAGVPASAMERAVVSLGLRWPLPPL